MIAPVAELLRLPSQYTGIKGHIELSSCRGDGWGGSEKVKRVNVVLVRSEEPQSVGPSLLSSHGKQMPVKYGRGGERVEGTLPIDIV